MSDADKTISSGDSLRPEMLVTDKGSNVAVPKTRQNERVSGHKEQEDENPEQTSENIFRPLAVIKDELIPPAGFDEIGYLRLNPDVRDAVELGQFQSGYSHYVMYGRAEGRSLPDVPREIPNTVVSSIDAGQSDLSSNQARCSIDALSVAPGAGLMIVGWIDDRIDPISYIRIISGGWQLVIDASRLFRVQRNDVENKLDSHASHAFGFFTFAHFEPKNVLAPINIELWRKSGVATTLQRMATIVHDVDLRNTVLAHLAGAAFFGNPAIESMAYLEQGVGAELVRFNKAITRRLVASPFVERFGPQQPAPRGTVIVCLYGKPEFYFLQNCLFSGLPGVEDYEFVYVCNSPELAETLLREAHSASLIYGLPNRVMILSGNAGFGGANNAAARIARSDRLLMVNPDILPRDRDWAKKHTDLLDTAAPERTRLFGVPLYYDDGSLMHGGMYFEIDVGLTMASGAPVAQHLCRVEHYGKGAPSDSPQLTRPRPVPAVTAAFLSIEREWFEQLGGFTEDFIFGHYEDADLCLKSIEKGTVPWLQDIRMWHLEGKGSNRQLAHEGGSIINRWLFTHTWTHVIEDGLKGPAPSRAPFSSLPSVASGQADSGLAKPKSDQRRRVLR